MQVKRTPSRRGGALPRRQVREADQKRKSPSKTQPPCFDALVPRYYYPVYRFVSRITDDPLGAVLLTHDAFNRTRKQLPRRCDEATVVRMLEAAVSSPVLAHALAAIEKAEVSQ
jgi:hypothetical protein